MPTWVYWLGGGRFLRACAHSEAGRVKVFLAVKWINFLLQCSWLSSGCCWNHPTCCFSLNCRSIFWGIGEMTCWLTIRSSSEAEAKIRSLTQADNSTTFRAAFFDFAWAASSPDTRLNSTQLFFPSFFQIDQKIAGTATWKSCPNETRIWTQGSFFAAKALVLCSNRSRLASDCIWCRTGTPRRWTASLWGSGFRRGISCSCWVTRANRRDCWTSYSHCWSLTLLLLINWPCSQLNCF